jgi:hypothetical protein
VNEFPPVDYGSDTEQEVVTLGDLPSVAFIAPEIVGGTESVSDASRDQALSLKEYPPVRIDHPGQRKPVPKDPAKRCPQWEDELAQYGLFPIETWSYIMWRESGCRPKIQNAKWDENGNIVWTLNKNGSYDTGLLQINSSWRSRVAEVCGDWAIENRMQGLRTVDCNLRFARFIMNNSEGGLSNWSM